MKKFPKARTANIIVQNLNNETLVYDLTINKAYCLNETSSVVYNACNGVSTFAEIKKQNKFSDELIFLALDELKKMNLLAENAGYVSPLANLNRREIIRRAGLASMAALPLITALVSPTAANAASTGSTACAPINQCIRANTLAYCPTGCTTNVTFIDFSSTDGSCTNISTAAHSFSCSCCQGLIVSHDVMRVG